MDSKDCKIKFANWKIEFWFFCSESINYEQATAKSYEITSHRYVKFLFSTVTVILNSTFSSLLQTINDDIKDNKPVKDIIADVRELMTKSIIPEHDVITIVSLAFLKSDYNGLNWRIKSFFCRYGQRSCHCVNGTRRKSWSPIKLFAISELISNFSRRSPQTSAPNLL